MQVNLQGRTQFGCQQIDRFLCQDRFSSYFPICARIQQPVNVLALTADNTIE